MAANAGVAIALSCLLLMLGNARQTAAALEPPKGVHLRQTASPEGTSITIGWDTPTCPDGEEDAMYAFEVHVFDQYSMHGNIDFCLYEPSICEPLEEALIVIDDVPEHGCLQVTDTDSLGIITHTVHGLSPFLTTRVVVKTVDNANDEKSDYSWSATRGKGARGRGPTPFPAPKGSGQQQLQASGLSQAFPAIMKMNVTDTGVCYGSVAIDVNNDGYPDLFTPCGESHRNMLRVNLGRSSNHSEHPFGSGDTSIGVNYGITRQDDSRGAVVADFNGDGRPDIFVVNYGERNELLLYSSETSDEGAIDPHTSYFVSSFDDESMGGDATLDSENSVGVIRGDFDGDGTIDLYVINEDADNELLLNVEGTGNFVKSSGGDASSNFGRCRDAVAFDADGDGDLDIFIAVGESNPSVLLINNGGGSFDDGTGDYGFTGNTRCGPPCSSSADAYAVTVGDFDGNGALDLYVAYKSLAVQNELMLNDGAGNFNIASGGSATDKMVSATGSTSCDIDGDGDMDIIVTQYQGNPDTHVHINDGTGHFHFLGDGATVQTSALSGELMPATSVGPLCFDADADGDNDLVFAKLCRAHLGIYCEPCHEYLENKGGMRFEFSSQFELFEQFSNVMHVTAFDANGDGAEDLFICTGSNNGQVGSTSAQKQGNVLFLNDGHGRYIEHTGHPTTWDSSGSVKSCSHAVAFDADGEGAVDLFVLYHPDSGMWHQLYLNNQQEQYMQIQSDGDISLFINYEEGEGVHIYGHFGVAKDFNGDGTPDLFVGSYDGWQTMLLNNWGSYDDGFGPFTGIIFEYQGSGFTENQYAFGGEYSLPAPSNTRTALAFDANSDGHSDIYLVNYERENILLLNNGQGSFTRFEEPTNPATNWVSSWWDGIAADFNGDGIVDLYLVTENYAADNALLYGNGDGTFTLDERVPDGVASNNQEGGLFGYKIAALDVNQDGNIDIFGVDKVEGIEGGLLVNGGRRGWTHYDLRELGNFPQESDDTYGMLAADLDNDGDEDVLTWGVYGIKFYLNCGTGYGLLQGGFCSPSHSRPTITSITPSRADTDGGSLALIQGDMGVDKGGTVSIGGEACPVTAHVNKGLWICVIPEAQEEYPSDVDPSYMRVVVNNFGWESTESTNELGFGYNAPLVTSVEPRIIDSGYTCNHAGFCYPPEGGISHSTVFTIRGSSLGRGVASKNAFVNDYPCADVQALFIGGERQSLHEVFKCTVGLQPGIDAIQLKDEVGLFEFNMSVHDQSSTFDQKICNELPGFTTSIGTSICKCHPGSEYRDESCLICGSNTYSSGGEQCIPCPSGATSSQNSPSVSSCACPSNSALSGDGSRCECAAGFKGDATLPSVGCTPCDATSFKPDHGNGDCTACPLGGFIPEGGDSTQSSSCACPANSVLSDDGSRCECAAGFKGDATAVGVGCSPCDATSFKPNQGNEVCTACPLGAVIPEGGDKTQSSSCACPANSVLSEDGSRCECVAGFKGDATTVSVGCTQCDATTYKELQGNSQCTACPLGALIPDGEDNTQPNCVCPSNSALSADLSASRCECLAGYQGDATILSVGCAPCGESDFKPDQGNEDCNSCPLGAVFVTTNDPLLGKQDVGTCVCPENSVLSADSSRCECSAGYGGDAAVLSVGCSECGTSAYKGNVANAPCTACPPGSLVQGGITNATMESSCACGANSELNTDINRCECSAGYGGDATVYVVGCSGCGTSAFKGEVGNAPCTPCPPGSVINNTDLSNGLAATSIEQCYCDIGTVVIASEGNLTFSCGCDSGYFGRGGEGTCQACPRGTYKGEPGDAISCTQCSADLGQGGTSLAMGSKTVDDCECASGYYEFEGVCMPCETGATCPGGDVSSMVALPGWWRSSETSTYFFSCDNPNGLTLCNPKGASFSKEGNGTGDIAYTSSVCRPGHEGPLCSRCQKGYGKTYGLCTKCDSSSSAGNVILVLVCLAGFLLILFLLMVNQLTKATMSNEGKKPGQEQSITLSVIKIMVNWLQMAAIGAQVRVATNAPVERFFQFQDLSNVSPFQFNSFNCLLESHNTFYTQFYSSLFIPPLCVLIGFSLTAFFFLVRRSDGVRPWDLFVMICQMLWFFCYSIVSQTILGIFECRDLDRGVSVLSADQAVHCKTSKHDVAVQCGYVFVVLYIIGLPLLVFLQLYRNRNSLEDRSVKVRYLFLYNNYREGLFWWEAINMLRKIGLVGALVLLQEDLGTQVFALSIISMAYLTLHASVKPYSSTTLNELETGTLFTTALTLSMCSFFYANAAGSGNAIVENGLTWIVIGLSISMLLWCVFLCLGDLFSGRKKDQDNEEMLPVQQGLPFRRTTIKSTTISTMLPEAMDLKVSSMKAGHQQGAAQQNLTMNPLSSGMPFGSEGEGDELPQRITYEVTHAGYSGGNGGDDATARMLINNNPLVPN